MRLLNYITFQTNTEFTEWQFVKKYDLHNVVPLIMDAKYRS